MDHPVRGARLRGSPSGFFQLFADFFRQLQIPREDAVIPRTVVQNHIFGIPYRGGEGIHDAGQMIVEHPVARNRFAAPAALAGHPPVDGQHLRRVQIGQRHGPPFHHQIRLHAFAGPDPAGVRQFILFLGAAVNQHPGGFRILQHPVAGPKICGILHALPDVDGNIGKGDVRGRHLHGLPVRPRPEGGSILRLRLVKGGFQLPQVKGIRLEVGISLKKNPFQLLRLPLQDVHLNVGKGGGQVPGAAPGQDPCGAGQGDHQHHGDQNLLPGALPPADSFKKVPLHFFSPITSKLRRNSAGGTPNCFLKAREKLIPFV